MLNSIEFVMWNSWNGKITFLKIKLSKQSGQKHLNNSKFNYAHTSFAFVTVYGCLKKMQHVDVRRKKQTVHILSNENAGNRFIDSITIALHYDRMWTTKT